MQLVWLRLAELYEQLVWLRWTEFGVQLVRLGLTDSDDVSNRLIGTAWLDKLIVQVDDQFDTMDNDQLMSSDQMMSSG